MKSTLFTCSAIVALAGAAGPAFAVDDQTPSEAAGTRYNPEPSVAEELVYLRDIIALQTLRLDEAEQALKQQKDLIERQSSKIDALERSLTATQQMARASGGASIAAASFGGEYVVRSGDTLSGIARNLNTSVSSIAQANKLASPYRLSVGQRLVVPGAAPAPQVTVAQAEAPAEEPAKIEKPSQTAAKPEPQKVADAGPGAISPAERPDVTKRAVDKQREEKKAEGGVEEVGVRPDEEEKRPYLSLFTDVGGILTPRGTLYAEPSVDFTVSSDNRFFFQGVEIVDAVLIGAIEATDLDRRAFTQSMGLRYGLTSRLELDGRISYVERHDRISGVLIDDQSSTFRELEGTGLGDAEVGLHYQLTNGRKFPYTILNMRAKAPTGKGPFEVGRDSRGVETELASGSGYWSIEPSLTFILPSDPAVLFANIGYQINMATSPDVVITSDANGDPTQIITSLDPGDAIRTSIGVGLSLNDRMSINFGYDQSHILATTSERLVQTRDQLFDINGDPILDAQNNPTYGPSYLDPRSTRQTASTVGAFLFGGSYAVNDRVRINFNTAVGATDEAPDIRVSLRAQVRLFD